MALFPRNKGPKDGGDFVPPKDPEKLIAWAEKKDDAGRTRLPERQLKLNLAYVLGEQWLVWDKDKKQFRRPQNRSGDPNAPVRITVNKMGSLVEHYISRLTKSNPEAEARPVTDDDDDVSAAKVSTRILHSELDRVHWSEDVLIDLCFWEVPCGWSYVQVCWDPTAGAQIGEDQDGGAINNGEVVIDIVPGFELSVDPNSKKRDLSDAMWGVRSVSMTDEAIWERWGVVPTGDPGRTIADEVFDLIDSASDNRPKKSNSYTVKQLWMRPCRAVPKGMVFTWVGETVLEEPVDFPYDHKRLPWVQFDLLPGIGTREGRTWVKDLIPLQADYNDARSREAAIRRTLTPKVFYPKGSIDPNRVSSRLELIGFNPGLGKPEHFMPDGGWMAQWEQGMNRADTEMGERSGQSDVSSGAASPSMPAAAILALQEADDTKLAVPAKLMSSSIARMGLMILELCRQFWTEERTVRTWSQEGTVDVDHFTGANISQQLDVRVDSETALPRSKAARTQLALELWNSEKPIFTDPRQFLRMLDMPGTDFIAESLNIDAKRAQRENALMFHVVTGKAEPQPVPVVYPFDNHQVHITEHDNFRKSPDYEKLSPEGKAYFDAHCNVHYENVLAQLGVPTPPGTENHPDVGPGGQVGVGGPEYLDPMTGMPPDSMAVAAGQAPSALEGSQFDQTMGIGGPGEQGAVPGIAPDIQAARTGN